MIRNFWGLAMTKTNETEMKMCWSEVKVYPEGTFVVPGGDP